MRLAVDRVFTLSGVGVVVTGTVLSGSVHVDDHVLISPSGLSARVRSLHVQNQPADTGRAGERCALNLAGESISKEAIHRGDTVIDPELHAPTDRIDARLRLLPSETRPVRQWFPARLHHASTEVGAHIVLLGDEPISAGRDRRCSTGARPADRRGGSGSLCDPRHVGSTHHGRRHVHRFATPIPKTADAGTPGATRRPGRRRSADRLRGPAGDAALCMGFAIFVRDRALAAMETQRISDTLGFVLLETGTSQIAIAPDRWQAFTSMLVRASRGVSRRESRSAGHRPGETAAPDATATAGCGIRHGAAEDRSRRARSASTAPSCV